MSPRPSISVLLVTALTLALAACSTGSPTPTATAPLPSATPTPPPVPDIVFEMKQVYLFDESVEIGIVNRSSETYYYQVAYSACYNLKFYDDSDEQRPYPREETAQEAHLLEPGQFIVPAGTHCDVISERPLERGARAVLLVWDQQLCTVDVWGCTESIQVEPGTYRIEGQFATKPGVVGPAAPGDPSATTTAEWTFDISGAAGP